MACSNPVLAVGIDVGTRLPQLVSELARNGFHLVTVPADEDLLTVLDEVAPTIIVVYHCPEDDSAHHVLSLLARVARRIPVIVLVDRSDFVEYYEFMCQGAFDYFDLTEDPRWIERAVEAAALLQAA